MVPRSGLRLLNPAESAGGWNVARVAVKEGVAETTDGLVLEAESDMSVDAGGDADVGVPEKFFDDDEVDALLQEQGGRRVS